MIQLSRLTSSEFLIDTQNEKNHPPSTTWSYQQRNCLVLLIDGQKFLPFKDSILNNHIKRDGWLLAKMKRNDVNILFFKKKDEIIIKFY